MKKEKDTIPDTDIKKELAVINGKFGAGTIQLLGANDEIPKIPVIPTASIRLNHALGVGGIPIGRITEMYGMAQSGKTTIALHLIAQAQKMGLTTAYIDVENALDLSYAQSLGVNIYQMPISQPECGELAFDVMESLIDSNKVGLIVLDSVAALVPKKEMEGDFGDSNMGVHAKLMSQAMRKLCHKASKNNCALLFLNQIRMKIGLVFGNPETTTGGEALKYYSTVRLNVRRKSKLIIDDEDMPTAITTEVIVAKNKVAPPFRKAEFDIKFGTGVDKCGEIFDLAVENEIIEKSGSWFSYSGYRIGQGKDKAALYIAKNNLFGELETHVIEALQKGKAPVQEETE